MIKGWVLVRSPNRQIREVQMTELLIRLFYVFAVLAVISTLCLHSARLADCARCCTFTAVIRSSPKETNDTSNQEERIRMANL